MKTHKRKKKKITWKKNNGRLGKLSETKFIVKLSWDKMFECHALEKSNYVKNVRRIIRLDIPYQSPTLNEL